MHPDDITGSVIKSGEQVFSINFSSPPHRKGLPADVGVRVTLHALPPFEEFFQRAGTGAISEAGEYGRVWVPLGEEPLRLYDVSQLPTQESSSKITYSLHRAGQALLPDHDGEPGSLRLTSQGPVYNLSFLRCVGISGSQGVSFFVRGVYSMDQIIAIKGGTEKAVAHFYRQYMLPYNMSIVVSTQQI